MVWTYGTEHSDVLVGPAKRMHIIHRQPTLHLHERPIQPPIRHLRDPLKRAVLRGLEVYRCCPVVAEVF